MTPFPSDIRVLVLREELTLHRACHGGSRTALVGSLRSNYEVRRTPPHPADLHASVLHMAVSMFEDASKIRAMAMRRPDRIGTHIATLTLRPGHGVCVADTSGPGHWSVWGVPAQLAGFVTDVERVR